MKSLKWSEQKLTFRFIVVELNSCSLLENHLSYQKRSDQKLNSRVKLNVLEVHWNLSQRRCIRVLF